MTNVFLYGALGKRFGKTFRFSISKPKDVISAINANVDGFEKAMIDLARKGANYSLIADDQIIGTVNDFVAKRTIKEIHIVPTVAGSGVVAAFTVGALAFVAASFAEGLLSSILVGVAFAAISFGVQALLAKPPSQNIPDAKAATSATSKSFLFSNKENITQQGNPVPLGYGRLRIGSAVIQQSIKNYPNSISTFDEFVNQATQEGQRSMAVINNQQI